MKRKILSTLLALFTYCFCFSQTGKIVGIVVDENGETMPGVNVYVDGIKPGVSTDIDGKFLFKVAPGKYSMTLSFVSYKEIKIPNVVVKDGEINDLSIVKMVPQDDSVLTEFEFVFHLDKGDDPAMDMARKKSPGAIDGVTNSTFRKMPVSTAGDAIKKVTGASIQDGKFAIIRGMSDRYNAAYINGAPLPSSESDRRAIAFDMFPSNMLDNIMINKTATPDLPAEFAGGVIQINTKSIPDETSQSVTFNIGYNSLSTGKDFLAYPGGKNDWMGIDDGSRAFPNGIPDTEQLKESDIYQRADYAKLTLTDWSLTQIKAKPNMSFQYALGVADTLFKNPFGIVMALNYANNNTTNNVIRAEYEGEQSETVFKSDSLNDVIFTNAVTSSALLNLSYKFKKRHTIRVSNIYSINSEDKVTDRKGMRNVTPGDVTSILWEKSNVRFFQENRMYSGQVNGEHLFLKDNLKVEWNGGLSNVYRNIPNRRQFVQQKSSESFNDSIPFFLVIDANNSRSGGLMFYSHLNERILSGKADVTYSATFSKKSKTDFKVGGLYQKRSRTFQARNFGYDKFSKGTSIRFDSDLLYLDESMVFTEPYMGEMTDSAGRYRGGFLLNENTRETDSYDASAELKAGYAMADIKYNEWFRLIGGARIESYNQFLETSEYGKPIIIDTTIVDVLPSVNLVITPVKNLNLRGAYYKTLSRPEFRELARFSFYDFITDFSISGSDSLQRALINNYDLRAEYYFKNGSMIAVSGFYKHIENATELASNISNTRSLYYTNVPSVTNRGIEFEVRLKLASFIKKDTNDFAQNTSLFGNFTLVKSKVDVSEIAGATENRPLQGQSPYLVNAGFTTMIPYVKLLTTVSYNIYGRRLYIVGNSLEPDYWENSRGVWDWQISKSLKHWEFKFNVRDLLAKNFILYQDLDASGDYNEEEDNTMLISNNPRIFTFGVTYKF